jgi:2-oxoglutarate ferredoxin oxidoreductase subunit alpha
VVGRFDLSRSEIIMRLGGEGGEGVISAGDMFVQGSARTGFHVFTFRTYPAEIKGGHAWYQVRISSQPVRSMGDGIDVLVAFDAEAYYKHAENLNRDGVIVYDPDRVKIDDKDHITYPIPLDAMAKKELNFQRGKNVLLLGILSGLFGLDPSSLENLVRRRLARRAELLEKNLEALRFGLDFVQSKISKQDPYYLGTTDKVSRLVMSGNEAIAAGALQAGCRFFAGYPISPASEIMELMAKALPQYGGVMVQAEDEMAAVSMVTGASYGGVKGMTATSGPGISLMSEVLGYASMAELPIVIVDAQRSGPSTGMPTKLEQGDLNHAVYTGHGDVPRFVLAAGSVEDCMVQMVNAFNLAERYQMPVIFLSDQSLSHRTETLLDPGLTNLPIWEREQPTPEQIESYNRYAETPTGVSPMALPGTPNGMYISTGLEHDERGHPDLAPSTHEAMTLKRWRKFDTAQQDGARVFSRYGAEDAEIGVIGWGSTEGVIREAVERAVEAGYRVAAFHPKVVYPLADEVRDFAASVKHVLVPEVNYGGQFAKHLRATFGIEAARLNKYGGLPFTPGEIFRKIEELQKS